MFRELCGDSTLKNVVLVTNMWDEVSPEDGQYRENQLTSSFFKPVLNKGAQMVRHLNTTESAHNIIREIIRNHPIVLQIQREVVDEEKDILGTSVGEVVKKEINELIERLQADSEKVQAKLVQALKEEDEVARGELKEEKRKIQALVEKVKKDLEEMTSSYAAEKERMGIRITRIGMDMEALQDLAGTAGSIPICW